MIFSSTLCSIGDVIPYESKSDQTSLYWIVILIIWAITLKPNSEWDDYMDFDNLKSIRFITWKPKWHLPFSNTFHRIMKIITDKNKFMSLNNNNNNTTQRLKVKTSWLIVSVFWQLRFCIFNTICYFFLVTEKITDISKIIIIS